MPVQMKRHQYPETDKVDSSGADFYMRHFAGDAFGFADMEGGFADGEAVGGEGGGCG